MGFFVSTGIYDIGHTSPQLLTITMEALIDVRSYMTSRGLRFFTLVAEETETFSKIYDPAITDILIDPDGRIVFMGSGGDSLRNAYLLYRSQSARRDKNQ